MWTGDDCTDRGCPGDPAQPELGSCSSRGICSLSDQTCDCDAYWKGDGCETADCAGDPDCNGLGLYYNANKVKYSYQSII